MSVQSITAITSNLFSLLNEAQSGVLTIQQEKTLASIFEDMVCCPELSKEKGIDQLRNRISTHVEIADAKNMFSICLRKCPDSMISSLLGLDEWKANSGGDTNEACKRIIACFKTEFPLLDLSYLNLTSLPKGMFKYCTQLRELSFYSNQLTSLPSEIGQCTQLHILFCSHNQLTSLPNEIGQCTQLHKLFCNSNQLKSLPSEIGRCTQLQILDCSFNQLTSLPSEIGRCTQLNTLKCSCNHLTSLPSEIGQCTQLNTLNCSCNHLTSLPSEIGQCTQLQILDFFANDVRSLPSEIGHCTQLNTLNYLHNQLTSLPRTLSRFRLSITIGIQQFKDAITDSSFKNLDENFFKRDPAVFQNILKWLDKLTTANEFKNPKSRRYFAARVLSILQFAQDNPEYFEVFKLYLIEALGTCVDRASLQLNYLEVQKRIHESKDNSLENLIEIFKGSLALEQIPLIAFEFMQSHPNADEIEVHLGFQTKLKKVFNLPIALASMNYFTCSQIEEKDLAEAETRIKKVLQNKKNVVNCLISYAIWEERLKKEFRKDLDTSLSKIQKDLDDLLENPPATSKELNEACIALKKTYALEEKAWVLNKTTEIVKVDAPKVISFDFLKNGKIFEACNALIQAFPEVKNELFGIYYALIKNQLNSKQNYYGCGEHAFLKKGAFQNFDAKDELRQCALALKVFELTLKGTSEKQNSLFELPGNLREALKWGFWLFEGMPEGEADFGKSFFLSNPTHPTVFQMIEEIKQNGLAVTSPKLKEEIDAFGLKLDSSLSNENLLKEFDKLSKQTRELIKKCLWVKAGRPTNKGIDFSGDVIKKNPRDPLLLTVVKNLQAKIHQ